MKSKNNKLITLLAVLAFLAVPLEGLLGQNLINQSTGIVRNGGVIRFIEDAGELQNEASSASDAAIANGFEATIAPNSGTIEFTATMGAAYNMFTGTNPIGLTAADRIQGWVIFSGAGAQHIQSAYLASLGLSGAGQKNYNAAQVFVDSIYTVAGGDRDYGTGRFTYDGPLVAGNLNDQTIVPESGAVGNTNIYNELYFEDGGTKTLIAGTTANAETEINIDDLAIVEVQGTMQALGAAIVTTAVSGAAKTTGLLLLDGTTNVNPQDGYFITENGAGALDGDIFVYNGGTYLVNGTGVQTFSGYVTVGEDMVAAATSGSITIEDGFEAVFDGDGSIGVLDLTNANGAIVVGDASEAEFSGVVGSFINGDAYGAGTRENMQFHINSIAHYTNIAQVVGTKTGFPYGNLTIDASVAGGNIAAEGNDGTNGIDVYVAGNFSLDAKLLLMDDDNNPKNGRQVLVMKDETKTVTYPDDADGIDEEVVGGFRWLKTGAYVAGTPLTFNNRMTQVTLNDVIADVQDFTVSMYPNTAPVSAVPTATDYAPGTDVKRRTHLAYTETGQDWTFEFQLGYTATELPAGFLGNTENMNSLRFRKYRDGFASEKLATGNTLGREPTEVAGNDNMLYVSLSGITTDPSASLSSAIIGDGTALNKEDEVFLRGGPTWFITVRPGRWSNPATWDEGVQPGPNDLALVRHTVHAGWVRATDNYQVNESVHLATYATDESELASYIQVFGGTVNAIDYNGALMFGTTDPDAAAPNNDNTKTQENPTWGLRSTAFSAVWTSPFGANGGTEDAAISAGDLYVTSLLGAEAAIPTNYSTNEQDGFSAVDNINGGVINFLGSQLTIPLEFTNHGIIANGGVIIIGQ